MTEMLLLVFLMQKKPKIMKCCCLFAESELFIYKVIPKYMKITAFNLKEIEVVSFV